MIRTAAYSPTVAPLNLQLKASTAQRFSPAATSSYAHKRKRSYGTSNNPIELSDSEDTDSTLDELSGNIVNHDFPTDHLADQWDVGRGLQCVLEIFPDIAHAFVTSLWESDALANVLGQDRCQRVLEFITERDNYPKEKDRRKGKEKEQPNTVSDEIIIDLESFRKTKEYQRLGSLLLEREFGEIPMTYVRSTFSKHKRVRQAYMELKRSLDLPKPPYHKRRNVRVEQTANDRTVLDPYAKAVHDELRSTRCEEDKIRAEKVEQDLLAMIEAENEAEAREAGLIRECGCCFTDSAVNRMISCDADEPHYFCYACAKMNVETLLGSGKCYPECMDMSQCKAGFLEQQLRVCVDTRTLARMFRLQQQDELRKANIDGLTECPFCDFMAICTSVLLDKEFRCENTEDCGKVSCRLCKAETHVPLSCDEAARQKELDGKLDARHVVEEAMSDALVRSCNKCKTRFVKEMGCNKMTCPKCGNFQCYVCHQSVKGYEHFSDRPGGCPTQDTMSLEALHEAAVKKAADLASAKVIAERPGLAVEDLAIKVSEEVRQAEELKRNNRPNHLYGHAIHHGIHQAVPPLHHVEGEAYRQALRRHAAMLQQYHQQAVPQVPPGFDRADEEQLLALIAADRPDLGQALGDARRPAQAQPQDQQAPPAIAPPLQRHRARRPELDPLQNFPPLRISGRRDRNVHTAERQAVFPNMDNDGARNTRAPHLQGRFQEVQQRHAPLDDEAYPKLEGFEDFFKPMPRAGDTELEVDMPQQIWNTWNTPNAPENGEFPRPYPNVRLVQPQQLQPFATAAYPDYNWYGMDPFTYNDPNMPHPDMILGSTNPLPLQPQPPTEYMALPPAPRRLYIGGRLIRHD